MPASSKMVEFANMFGKEVGKAIKDAPDAFATEAAVKAAAKKYYKDFVQPGGIDTPQGKAVVKAFVEQNINDNPMKRFIAGEWLADNKPTSNEAVWDSIIDKYLEKPENVEVVKKAAIQQYANDNDDSDFEEEAQMLFMKENEQARKQAMADYVDEMRDDPDFIKDAMRLYVKEHREEIRKEAINAQIRKDAVHEAIMTDSDNE